MRVSVYKNDKVEHKTGLSKVNIRKSRQTHTQYTQNTAPQNNNPEIYGLFLTLIRWSFLGGGRAGRRRRARALGWHLNWICAVFYVPFYLHFTIVVVFKSLLFVDFKWNVVVSFRNITNINYYAVRIICLGFMYVDMYIHFEIITPLEMFKNIFIVNKKKSVKEGRRARTPFLPFQQKLHTVYFISVNKYSASKLNERKLIYVCMYVESRVHWVLKYEMQAFPVFWTFQLNVYARNNSSLIWTCYVKDITVFFLICVFLFCVFFFLGRGELYGSYGFR